MTRPGPARLRHDELVLGYDGSAGARDALALGVPLAELWHVGVQVLTIHTPVVLGGQRAASDRELAALRCAETGVQCLGGTVRARCAEQRAPEIIAGLHAASVGHAGLVVGRTHRPLRARIRPRHTIFEDAPVPVAVARRRLRPHPALHHVVLALPPTRSAESEPGDRSFEALIRFAGRYLRHTDLRVTLCALGDDSTETRNALRAGAFQLGGVVGRAVQTGLVPAHEAAWTWVDDELLVCVGRPVGAHGHLGTDRTERALLAGDGPSLLIIPPAVPDAAGAG